MSNTEKNRTRLINLLKELFQLDQPELDFGLYKIMHAKSVQINRFLENDLLKEIRDAFGEADGNRAAEARAKYEAAIEQAIKYGAPSPEETEGVKEAKTAFENAKEGANAESDVYDHLYRFFERYYDSGDFMSRRYYGRENDSRAAPYAVPYDGREVYLHWANKDQYYIKSSDYLTNYTFDLHEAIRQEGERQASQKGKGQGLDTSIINDDQPLKVHFRIVDASESEHGNIKIANDQKRFFIIHADKPVEGLLVDEGKTNQLIVNFQYRSDDEKTGQDNKWQETRLQQAEAVILEALKADTSAAAFLQGLTVPSPTDSKNKRTLLGKYLQKYAARNTMDYFIHKDLGGFLRRELDFYIKNEIMRLDDIENAEVPKVEQYLVKIRVLRRIAQQLIAFLAQLEDFQKKLWLKKKFVIETHYCITLDRIPESFYAEIATNNLQREEWVKLFAIDEIKADLVNPAYSAPLTTEFLRANPYLLVDTALFDDGFKQRLLDAIHDLDAQCDGVLIHSENFQALGLMQQKYRKQVKCVYTDPPYNTKGDGFPYKDSYKHSSWASMMLDRLVLAHKILRDDGLIAHYIDENEHMIASQILSSVFGEENRVGDIVWKNSSKNDQAYVSMQHEYLIAAVKNKSQNKGDWVEKKEGLDEIYAAFDSFRKKHGSNWTAIHEEALNWYKQYPESNPIVDSKHYSWMDERGVYFPDNISGPNFGQYRYDVYHPITSRVVKEPASGWRYPESTMLERIKSGLVHFGKDEKTVPNNKTYLKNTEYQSLTSIKYRDGRVASKALNAMFGEKTFANPKDADLSARFLKAYQTVDTSVLDYFGGTGTTAQAVINLNREDQGNRKYILVEQGGYFDNILKPRLQKVIYSKDWKDGKPVSRAGISHCFKIQRLESYEDALNNLVLQADSNRDAALVNNPAMQRDYLLNYFLNVETESSQSLLNLTDFRDPTTYKMRIKKPGSDEQALQSIDLIETFNWLIGLWVEHMASPQEFSAEFVRETDPDLPKDQNTRLICKRLKADANGRYWFRLTEGYTHKIPGDNTSKVPTLIVWRKQTDDAEKDNAVLQTYLMEKLQISPREQTYGVIYVNGSHTLPNPVVEGEQTKVRLIEEAFHNAMWSGEVG